MLDALRYGTHFAIGALLALAMLAMTGCYSTRAVHAPKRTAAFKAQDWSAAAMCLESAPHVVAIVDASGRLIRCAPDMSICRDCSNTSE